MMREGTQRGRVVLRAVTDVGGLTHLVTDEAMTIGCRFGRYAACCGVEIVAASLTAPESGRCKRCLAWRAGA